MPYFAPSVTQMTMIHTKCPNRLIEDEKSLGPVCQHPSGYNFSSLIAQSPRANLIEEQTLYIRELQEGCTLVTARPPEDGNTAYDTCIYTREEVEKSTFTISLPDSVKKSYHVDSQCLIKQTVEGSYARNCSSVS